MVSVIAESTTAAALLEYICQHPGEDDARLVYADLLEERGEDERAWAIRHQIVFRGGTVGWTADVLKESERGFALMPGLQLADIVFRRGFPAEVILTALAFAGGPCGRCQEPFYYPEGCPACHGKGRTEGHAAALFKSAPIELVKLTGKQPYHTFVGWWGWGSESEDHRNVGSPGYLPPELFNLLPKPDVIVPPVSSWRTERRAFNALATAALLLGRRRAWPCPRCKGRGKICIGVDNAGKGYDMECPSCSGTGHTVEIR